MGHKDELHIAFALTGVEVSDFLGQFKVGGFREVFIIRREHDDSVGESFVEFQESK